MIHLYKTHVIKFIISLTSHIQILVYYLLKVSLITFIVISFASFFVVKFIIYLAFFQPKKKKKTYYKIKRMDFCYIKITILNTS